VVNDQLYASSPDDLLAVIRALDNKLDRVMLVGHNHERGRRVPLRHEGMD